MSPSDEGSQTALERITGSALELFAERGHGSVSVKAIAQHAGVSQGLMYNYFPGKEVLLREIFLTGLRDVQVSWREAEGIDPLDNLRALLDESFRLVREHASFWRLFYALRSQRAVAAELSGDLKAWSALIHNRLERYCRDLNVARPEVEARVLFAFIDGVAQQLVLDEAYPLAEVTSALLGRYAQLKEEHETRLAQP
jgi:AcrR family transcriptional regulator